MADNDEITNQEIAELIARSMAEKPEAWALRPNPHLTVTCAALGLGVMEFGGALGADARRYRVADAHEGGNGETVFEIGPEKDRAARDILAAAMAPWREEAERSARLSLREKLSRQLGGEAVTRAAVKKKLS